MITSLSISRTLRSASLSSDNGKNFARGESPKENTSFTTLRSSVLVAALTTPSVAHGVFPMTVLPEEVSNTENSESSWTGVGAGDAKLSTLAKDWMIGANSTGRENRTSGDSQDYRQERTGSLVRPASAGLSAGGPSLVYNEKGLRRQSPWCRLPRRGSRLWHGLLGRVWYRPQKLMVECRPSTDRRDTQV